MDVKRQESSSSANAKQEEKGVSAIKATPDGDYGGGKLRNLSVVTH